MILVLHFSISEKQQVHLPNRMASSYIRNGHLELQKRSFIRNLRQLQFDGNQKLNQDSLSISIPLTYQVNRQFEKVKIYILFTIDGTSSLLRSSSSPIRLDLRMGIEILELCRCLKDPERYP